MKKRILLMFVVVLFTLFTLTVLAHSGRTDSNGGHHDRQNGGYHYHHGYPAHDHYDIDDDGDIDCEIFYEKNNQITSQKASNWIETAIWGIVFFIILGFVLSLFWRSSDDESSTGCGCLIAYVVIVIVYDLFESYPVQTLITVTIIGILSFLCHRLNELYNKIDYKGRINKYESMVNEFVSYVTRYKEKEAELLEFERIPIPDDCEVKGGLPAEKGTSDRWGEKFTVYLSEKGGKVHIVRGCCSVFNERHIYEISQYKNFYYALCKKCGKNYVVPDMLWYENYLQYSELLREVLELSGKIEVFKWRSVDCKKECYTLVIKFILLFDKHSKEQLKEIDKKLKTTIENNQTL